MQTIVIVGGGAGGLELATRLAHKSGKSSQTRVVLVDKSPAHFWKPLLHTVASGKRDPRTCQIEYSAQGAEHGFEFIQAEVTGLDRANKSLSLISTTNRTSNKSAPAASSPRLLQYDKLVLALGSVTNFYNIPGAADHVLTLDNVEQAEAFHQQFLGACMRASERKSAGQSEKRFVDIVIVGGGATGVELAAELNHSAHALAHYKVHALDPKQDVRIKVLERGDFLLPHMSQQQSQRAARTLRGLGIDVMLNTAVSRVSRNAVHLADGEVLHADMTLWAAGVEAPAICEAFGLPLNWRRQIVVKPTLQSIEDQDVYAIGDCAGFVCPILGAIPPRAQVAHQQAMYLANTLLADASRVPPFAYRDYGSLVSLGPVAAIGELANALTGGQIKVKGAFAHLLYTLMYQKHLLAVQGVVRMATHTLVDWLRAKITPPVKLH